MENTYIEFCKLATGLACTRARHSGMHVDWEGVRAEDEQDGCAAIGAAPTGGGGDVFDAEYAEVSEDVVYRSGVNLGAFEAGAPTALPGLSMWLPYADPGASGVHPFEVRGDELVPFALPPSVMDEPPAPPPITRQKRFREDEVGGRRVRTYLPEGVMKLHLSAAHLPE